MTTTSRPRRRAVPRQAPTGLRTLADDDLGSLVMATVVSELRWVPDVAPRVVDRLARDAVAYPELLAAAAEPSVQKWAVSRNEPRHGRGTRLMLVAVLAMIVAVILVAVLGSGQALGAGAGNVTIRVEPFATGLSAPVHVTPAGDGSAELYVVEQQGTIRVVDPSGAVALEPYLDITGNVRSGGEQGLLGLAFHPDLAEDPRLFVNYTAAEDAATVVSEIPIADGRPDPARERILMRIPQPFPNHNGGTIAFDREGYLLIGTGDGGAGGDPLGSGQDPDALLGKLLRIDVDGGGDPYGIPPDNGFVDDPAYRPEIHASGLRNPWKFSVDPDGGDIYIADVGQEGVEEISVLPGGAGGVSLGWNRFEGDRCYSEPCDPDAHLAPAVTYTHDEGCSVVGGHVYRGALQPALDGLYLFGDYCASTIWAADADGMLDGPVAPTPIGHMEGTLVSFGQDAAGEPLAVDHGGRILRVLADQEAGAGSAFLSSRSRAPEGRDVLAAEAATSEPSPQASAAVPFDPTTLTLRTVRIIDNLDEPVTVAGDGTGSGLVYVVERPGVVRVIDPTGPLPDPLLDISDKVSTDGERGLHAIAFHPDYAENGRFFVHYNDLDGNSIIEEYRTRRGRPIAVGKGRILLSVEQPFINNKGGPIFFGPEGSLYIALGDGGGSSPGDPMGFGQRKDSLLGKILRIDVDGGRRYAIPKDNPFASRKKRKGFAPETWAYGLRDPRGASIDPVSGDLWIGDAGQDRFEEIDVAPAGQGGLNYGWSDMEGTSCHLNPDCDPVDYAMPVYTYDQVPPDCGVVGGHVYRGSAIPDLVGAYVFSDTCSGIIRALDASAVRAGQPAKMFTLLDAPRGWRAFGIDDDGELYLTSLDGGVYRIEAESTP